MSSNQRPGKIRVLSAGEQKASVPQRRRDDPHGDGRAEPVEVRRGSTVQVRRQPSMRVLPMLSIFVLGSALGGAAVAALGLFKVPGL